MNEPEVRKRRRPAVSCTLCRRRKIRCNRETPCSNCRRSKNEACVYENANHTEAGQPQPELALGAEPSAWSALDATPGTSVSTQPSRPSSMLATSSTDTSSPARAPAHGEEARLRLRIRQLEDQLSRSTLRPTQTRASTPASNIETTNSLILGGTMHVHTESLPSGQSWPISRSVTHKTRTFGQSHWGVTGFPLIRDVLETLDAYPREETLTALSAIDKCKSLARIIKARRAPAWPCLPTPDLPSRDVSDTLIDCYLRTTESIYRVLHIPSFRRDYDALWTSDTTSNVSDKTPFIVQLKLVLAIGAITHDELFSLRTSAIRWIYEAQIWVSEPKFKSRLDIQYLQTNLLLLIAQQGVGIGGDSMWVSVGALFRRAVYMGLHRDPVHLPPRSLLAAEMRRRLWNTIIELMLQSSLISGGPPFLSLKEFDAAPPANLNDEQLMENNPVPRPETEFTQTCIALALRRTFSQRLAVVKFLNQLSSSGTYEETLRLDANLRSAYKSLSQTLQACMVCRGSIPPQFETRAVDFFMHRYLMSLHAPYYGPALGETTYAFSRKVVIDSSLKIWRAACPKATQSRDNGTSPESGELPRLVLCSSGFHPTVAIHAAVLIAIELRMQLHEEESIGHVPLRPDLVAVLWEAKEWCLQVLRAGETNVKGNVLITVLVAQIEGLRKGLEKEKVAEMMVEAAITVAQQSLPIMEEMAAAQGYREADGVALGDLTVDGVEDWGFMVGTHIIAHIWNAPVNTVQMSDVDAPFEYGNPEPMSWIFNDNVNLGIPSVWS